MSFHSAVPVSKVENRVPRKTRTDFSQATVFTAKDKRAFFAFLAALLFSLLCVFSAPAYADVRLSDEVYGATVEERGLSANQCPNIDAEYAYVIDSEGTVFFQRASSESAQIASVTKIMTAVVTLDAVRDGLVTLETEVLVTEEAAFIGESTAGLQEGDTMKLETALRALLIPSGNDAAMALAQMLGALFIEQGIAEGETPLEAFVAQMNKKAEELGCVNTLFENPHGLDYDDYAGDLHSCAMDVCTISAYAMKDETFREIVILGDSSIKVRRGNAPETIELSATDLFPEMYEYAIGIKTGYTELAGSCFAGATNNGERELYAAVLNSSDDTQRFRDATTLCDWVYSSVKDYPLAHSDQTVTYQGTSVPLAAEVAHTGWMDKTVKACLADPQASVNIFVLNGNVSQEVEYKTLTDNVRAGDVVGSISFKQRNEVIETMDLIACEDVKAPNFFQSIRIWFARQFSDGPKQAQSVLINETPLIIDKSQPEN